MIRFLTLCACLATACRSDADTKDLNVEDSASTSVPSSTGPVTDSAAPEDPPEPAVDDGPNGAWVSCYGRLSIDESSFSWEPNGGSCTVEGTAAYADGELTLTVANEEACPELPWWLNLAETGPAVFAPSIVGTRLALFPTTSPPTARFAQFEETLDVESWSLTNNEGITSTFELCWANGAFFGGRYRNTEGSCDFLSCGGRIIAHAETDMGEHWTTTCEGTCPCGGIVTVEDRTDDSLTGRFFGSNCARSMSGTFAGAPSN